MTLRDAAVRDWATMPKQNQLALRGYVLHHVFRHAYLTASMRSAQCVYQIAAHLHSQSQHTCQGRAGFDFNVTSLAQSVMLTLWRVLLL